MRIFHLIAILIVLGAHVSIQSMNRKATSLNIPPLLKAADEGNIKGVIDSLNKGASIETRDMAGYTALTKATARGYEHIVKFLLDRGANVNTVTELGTTPLGIAASNGYAGIVKLLLKHDPVIDFKHRNVTALASALWSLASRARDDASLAETKERIAQIKLIIKELLEHGATVDNRTLISAQMTDDKEVIQLVKDQMLQKIK